ncbi:hypothetical protein J2S43_001389 [Catenuloplanes nepalensis]|uniref:Uncharacterized protein n=1 Tax=Catenuloplanes nepalensis TaxID=587533 RepID=A0ABT9MN62_9ACTN|nr:hypothetical protein [Catenuloplanes nepalensis]MDP9792877.1 hypothetical protein [Catenuloplanes nepalensis]
MIDWRSVRDLQDHSGVVVGSLLDRLERQPDLPTWRDLERRLVVEAECWCSAGFAALPALARLARSGAEADRDRALDLAAVIVRSTHRNQEHDDLVRRIPETLATLHRLSRDRLATCTGPALVRRLQGALAFAGYTFWATISMDFTDEHYDVGCPGCATRLAIVIGEYGHYSAIRDHNDGDIHRHDLRPTGPADLTGIARWMHDAAVTGGDATLAGGIAYLFGRAACGACGSTFDLADWLEAENGPRQPIDPIVPKTDRSI